MSLTFQSIRSSSSGNCLILCSPQTKVLIDCGLNSLRLCRQVLDDHIGGPQRLDALIVTHAHVDHIGYPALRTLAEHDGTLYAHPHAARYVHREHKMVEWDRRPRVVNYLLLPFRVGDLMVQPIEVPHAPAFPTFGFVIEHDGEDGRRRKVVVATDFHDYAAVLDHFVDADFIFVEANHDPGLLRLYPNYASRWHMPNWKTAGLLYEAVARSKRPPKAVMLGHLSRQRNRPDLALDSVRERFERAKAKITFHLSAAPPFEPSERIAV